MNRKQHNPWIQGDSLSPVPNSKAFRFGKALIVFIVTITVGFFAFVMKFIVALISNVSDQKHDDTGKPADENSFSYLNDQHSPYNPNNSYLIDEEINKKRLNHK